jgi:hypothetical protein
MLGALQLPVVLYTIDVGSFGNNLKPERHGRGALAANIQHKQRAIKHRSVKRARDSQVNSNCLLNSLVNTDHGKAPQTNRPSRHSPACHVPFD